MSADLIIILVAVGASIISAIVKHKNKKKQQQSTVSTVSGEPKQPKGAMAKIQRMIEEFEKVNKNGGDKAIPAKKKPQLDNTSPSPFDFIPSSQVSLAPDRILDDSTAKLIETAKLRESKIRKIDINELELEREEVRAMSNILKDFDLRKAVIYSEILKPKF